jgi:hypothetical protein
MSIMYCPSLASTSGRPKVCSTGVLFASAAHGATLPTVPAARPCAEALCGPQEEELRLR